MMNLADSDSDSGHALGNPNHHIQTGSNNDSGAGVNAGPKVVDRTFVASDPLSEIVWSPKNGLTLKCADGSLINNRRPTLLWDVRRSFMDSEISNIASMIRSPRQSPGPALGNDDKMEEVNTIEGVSLVHCNEKKDIVERSEGDRSLSLTRQHQTEHAKIPTDEEIQRKKDSPMVEIPSPRIIPKELDKMEFTAENDLIHLTLMNKEASPTNSRIVRYQMKGKAKVLSEGGYNSKLLNDYDDDNDDSHESVESCNSAGLIADRKRRQSFEEELISGSKRIKKQRGENPGSRENSSFMNWISNMVKGLPSNNHKTRGEKFGVSAEERPDSGGRNTGFKSIFESLCFPSLKVPESRIPAESGHLMTLAEKPCTDITPISCFRDNGKRIAEDNGGRSPENKSPASDEARDGVSSSDSSSKCKNKIAVKITSDAPTEAFHSRKDLLGSLWITRLCPKTPSIALNLDQCNPVSNGTVQSSGSSRKDEADVAGKKLQNQGSSSEASFGFKRIPEQNYQNSICKSNPQKFKSSEVMASVFAKRLDALKLIFPSDLKDDADCPTITCLFCGKKGHDLRLCSEITEAEIGDLLRNVGSYDGAEKSPCLCIRCFQLDHWANRCPKQNQLEKIASSVNAHTEADLCLNKILKTKETHDRKNSGFDEAEKPVNSVSVEELKTNQNQLTPLCNFMGSRISDLQEDMFDSIRKLRLSRAAILKIMNSPISLSHLDGFFLRLRLGNWEKGLGSTGYFVACIIGVEREKSPNDSKQPISVIVGGTKCVVESQYISNRDFLEDELVAWWREAIKNSGKFPSHNDLKSKIEERKRLGF